MAQVGWITVLDAVPGINMLHFLPEYLEGLFEMLSAQQREIRQQANAVLDDFLQEITQASEVRFFLLARRPSFRHARGGLVA
jgi:vacuole morphology and inheritance protein 14